MPKKGTDACACCDIKEIEIVQDPRDWIPNLKANSKADDPGFWKGIVGNHADVAFYYWILADPKTIGAWHSIDYFPGDLKLVSPQKNKLGGYDPVKTDPKTVNIYKDLKKWYSEDLDTIIVAHSQGANIALHMLEEGCKKKK